MLRTGNENKLGCLRNRKEVGSVTASCLGDDDEK